MDKTQKYFLISVAVFLVCLAIFSAYKSYSEEAENPRLSIYVKPLYTYLNENKCYANIRGVVYQGRRSAVKKYEYQDLNHETKTLTVNKMISVDRLSFESVGSEILYLCDKGGKNISVNIAFPNKFWIYHLPIEEQGLFLNKNKVNPVEKWKSF